MPQRKPGNGGGGGHQSKTQGRLSFGPKGCRLGRTGRLLLPMTPNARYCFFCSLWNNGPTQDDEHRGILQPGSGKKHEKAVRRAHAAVRAGAVLPFSGEDEPMWVIGAKNICNYFTLDAHVRTREQGYKCQICEDGFFKDWGKMVGHLSRPSGKAAHATEPVSKCVAHAAEQRARHQKMVDMGKILRRQGVRASSERCGHRGCVNAAVLTGRCSNCGSATVFCPEHSYCCVCHHWYDPGTVRVDPDCCDCAFHVDHCRPRYVCGVCDGSLKPLTDPKTVALRALIGQPLMLVGGTVEPDVADGVALGGPAELAARDGQSIASPELSAWPEEGGSEYASASSGPVLGTGTAFHMLFSVSYSDYYLDEFFQLCYANSINAMPPDRYKILGYSGTEFQATFFESPELRPAAQLSDFPLCVWRCAVGEDEWGAWGTRVYGVE